MRDIVGPDTVTIFIDTVTLLGLKQTTMATIRARNGSDEPVVGHVRFHASSRAKVNKIPGPIARGTHGSLSGITSVFSGGAGGVPESSSKSDPQTLSKTPDASRF